MSVDFPAPFSPKRIWTSPERRSKSTWSKATTPGNCFDSLLTCSSGASPAASAAGLVISSELIVVIASRCLLHCEYRLPILRGQGRSVIEFIDVRLVDYVDFGTDVLAVVLALEDPNRLIDRDTPLNDGRVRRCREDTAFLDVFVHAGGEVI